jgi:hypothetical protein
MGSKGLLDIKLLAGGEGLTSRIIITFEPRIFVPLGDLPTIGKGYTEDRARRIGGKV